MTGPYRSRTKLYMFDQNNTHGVFDEGVGHVVLVEAENADQANMLALEVGIYFNGCAQHRDCACCGDRWEPVVEDDAIPVERPISNATAKELTRVTSWLYENSKRRLRIVYADGTQCVYMCSRRDGVQLLVPSESIRSPGLVTMTEKDDWEIN